MSRQRVLFAVARPPYPCDTGARIRSWNTLAGFAKRYDVDVISYCDPSMDLSETQAWVDGALELGVSRVEQIPNPALGHGTTVPQLISAAVRGLPVSTMKYRNDDFSRRFRDRLGQGYDLVHIETVHLAGEAASIVGESRPFVTLNAHNVECQIADRMRDLERFGPRWAALSLHARNMRRFECDAFRACDAVLAVSREDCDQIDRMCGVSGRAVLVENGVDDRYFTPGGADRECADELVFVGSMDWLPNVDGVIGFVRDVLPRIRQRRPAAHLSVVGRKPHPDVLALHDPANGVTVTGTVDDVRPYVHGAAVAVVPLRYGGGTRLKILEAFSMSTAVVSTSLGCEGILCKDEEHLMIRDDAESFASACLDLMDDGPKRQKVGEKGRKLALSEYVWPSVIGRMHDEIDRRRKGGGADARN